MERIRRATAADAPRLRELTLASKAHWGYDRAKVSAWVDGLDLSGARVEGADAYVAEAGGRTVGWAELLPPVDGVCMLEHLWVDPAWMGRGVGSRLFGLAADRARELGAAVLEWEAEPNAAGFYAKMGGRHRRTIVGDWGRPLSVMGVELAGPR